MKRKNRLSRNADFTRLRREGRSWSNQLLVLSVKPNSLTYSRFGFVVSRRIGTAVRRNRVKRLLREAARFRLPQVTPGWDLVVIARAAASESDFRALDDALSQLLRAGGVLIGADSDDPAAGANQDATR